MYKNLKKLQDEKVDVKDDLAFYTFMISNNEVLYQDEYWFVVNNCKHLHPTAFVYNYCEKFEQLSFQELMAIQRMLMFVFPNKAMYINQSKDKSLTRFHFHLPQSLLDVNFKL